MSINVNNTALNEILEAINELPSSKEEQEKTVDITENGETVVVPEDENTTLSKVTVNVDVPTKEEQSKTIDITENGTTEIFPDEGKTLSKVAVNVEVESGGAGLILSDFTGKDNKPKIADLRSFFPNKPNNWNYDGVFAYLFSNTNAATGFYTDLHTVYLPDWISCFSGNMFQNCGNLINLYGDTSNVTLIGGSAFGGCVKLTEFPYMPKLNRIDASAFYNCKGLTEIKIYNTLTTFSSGAFNACTNITDIYVPWAENAVANAPWGATNATIHYNSEV